MSIEKPIINLMFSNIRIFLYSEDRWKKGKVFNAHIDRKSEETKNMGKLDKIINSTLWAVDETQLFE